jgi:hypothetical protein
MPRLIAVFAIALTGVVTFADLAAAGPFRRVWERRKAELGGELNASLSAKLNADVARESKAAEQRISDARRKQIDGRAKSSPTR